MIVTMLNDEQSRVCAGETIWSVEQDGREAHIFHLHNAVVRAERRGGAWYAVAHKGSTVRVHDRDFTAALKVARAMLSGGAL